MRQTINKNKDAGYILIELAMVLICVGFVMAAGLPLYKTYTQRNAFIETNKRIDIIARAISNYAQMYGRIPCPALPLTEIVNTQFGVEYEIAGGEIYGRCDSTTGTPANPATPFGIIPFRTLGIPEQYARDGYNNFFSYYVSPAFTTDNRIGVAPDLVHRRMEHLVAGNNFALLPLAQFCAPLTNAAQDLEVKAADGTDLYAHVNTRDFTAIARPAATPNANIHRTNTATSINTVTAVALAIVSHGENGAGAYQPDGTQAGGGGTLERNTYNNTAGPTVGEIHISDDLNNNFQTPNAQYDDIIKYYTQDEIFAIAGGGSCEQL